MMPNSLAANGYGRDLRLRSNLNVPNFGHFELFSEQSQRYTPVCFPGLSYIAAHIVCHQLGFTTVLYITHILTTDGLMPALQLSIDCHGYEQSFDECWIINQSTQLQNCSYIVGMKCTACNYDIKESSGIIASPGFPIFYPQSIECEWTIVVPRYYELVIDFGVFDLPYSKSNHTCINGYLEIGYIVNKGRYRLGRFCGQYIERPFIAETTTTWIRFYSGWPRGSHFPTGFNLTFERRKIDYGNATIAQILLALVFGGFLMVMMIACVCCYWKRTCKAKQRKDDANRKQTMVKLVEQLAQETPR